MQQQQPISTQNMMPALPKEKAAITYLNDHNLVSLKIKDENQILMKMKQQSKNISSSDMVEELANDLLTESHLPSESLPCDNVICCSENMKCRNDFIKFDEFQSITSYTESNCSPLTMTLKGKSEKIQIAEKTYKKNEKSSKALLSSPGIKNDDLITNSTKSLIQSKVFPKRTAIDFVFGKYIGEGSYSTVFLGRDIHTNRQYAIKVCIKQHIVRENKQEYVKRERQALSILSNVPGFVNLFCTFQDTQSLYFVMRYAKHGDLLPYINKVGSFDLDCARHYTAELVLACEHMHRLNIVHRDLKPENILLDENMHTLVADFGSAKIFTLPELKENQLTSVFAEAANMERNKGQKCDDKCSSSNNEKDMDNQENFTQQRTKRRASFVGTAQYVSPEVLKNSTVTPAVDLWALGCIMYQMISGLPPFRAKNEYLIFKEILSCNIEFPRGFDPNAENLIRNLLKLDPAERIGSQDSNYRYDSIRSHPFFEGIDFNMVRNIKPPQILPFLPGLSNSENTCNHYSVPKNLEPGLDENQLRRLLGMELGTFIGVSCDTELKENNSIQSSSNLEKQKILDKQKSDKWHIFSENEIILKKGFVNKRKGLFSRKRMLLLTTGPRLIYIDPVQIIKKGEIPWSQELRVEAKNFKIFFVHTPNRTYFLEDPEGYGLEWVDAIVKVHKMTYPN